MMTKCVQTKPASYDLKKKIGKKLEQCCVGMSQALLEMFKIDPHTVVQFTVDAVEAAVFEDFHNIFICICSLGSQWLRIFPIVFVLLPLGGSTGPCIAERIGSIWNFHDL